MATEYFTVVNEKDYLDPRVAKMMEQGWEPLGGVSIARAGGSNPLLAQAMVRNPKMSESLLEAADLEIKRLRDWLERIRTNPECESTVEMAMKALAGERIKP